MIEVKKGGARTVEDGGRSSEKLPGEKLECEGREIHVRVGGLVKNWPVFIARRRTVLGRKRLGRKTVDAANT